jgi:hypothetical protein
MLAMLCTVGRPTPAEIFDLFTRPSQFPAFVSLKAISMGNQSSANLMVSGDLVA